MEKSLEFNSQICTTREQSERLLSLGLKKETADMEIEIFKEDNTISGYISKGYWENEISDALIKLIPAWSLHRLIEILSYTPELSDFATELQYDAMIIHIANAIEANNINKDYLENEVK